MDWALLSAWADSPLWLFCSHVALLSATAFGGGMLAPMPDLHRFAVETHHWVTSEQFASSFALAQASPGPNFMYVSVIGWQVAGWLGAVLASIAVTTPPTLITYAVIRIGVRRSGSGDGAGAGRLQRAIRHGLLPVSAGLMLASGWVLANNVDHNWRAALMTIAFVVVLVRTRVHPLWLIAAGATAGAAGLV